MKIYNMKTFFIVLVLSGLAAVSSEEKTILVKWARQIDDPNRTSSLFKLPENKVVAIRAGWVEAKGVNALGALVYCPNGDPRVCVLFDKNGISAGYQMGFLVSELEPMQRIYNLSRINTYKKTNVLGFNVWITTVYTTNPEIIKGKQIGKTTEAIGLWIDTNDGGYIKVPQNLKNLSSNWLKQICVPEQGTHYFYNLSPNSRCEDIQPWFSIFDKGRLVGGGIMGFGKISTGFRNWYEFLAVPIQRVIPDGPKCLGDWFTKYGLIYTHVFVIKKPQLAKC